MAQKQNTQLEDPALQQRLAEWLQWDQNETTKAEIARLLAENDVEQLKSRLLTRLAFGTAGLRGSMGPGFAHMNDLVIIQTSQGLAKYLLQSIPTIKDSGVVIGFDNRHNSARFAQLTAAVFLSQSIPVFLYSKICPTPFVPFAVLQLRCSAGVMVTASHNPKEDNGYKVYWENGAQITAPHDKGIAAAILENMAPWAESWSFKKDHPLLKDPLKDMLAAYKDKLKTMCHYGAINAATPVKFVYTPMHGVGQDYIMDGLSSFQLKPFVSVELQKNPDPDFPTVKYPNPEEGKSALDLAVAAAEKSGARVILANDPDADRLALAEKLESGTWKIFSGNEIGTLLGWWMWHSFEESKKDNIKPGDCYMIASTVSSKMLRSLATIEGFHFEETLTGFKWIANRADVLRKEGKTVLFGFEEAIGFMCGDFVLDKDGVSACLIAAEMTAWLETKGLTIQQQLEKLFEKYGYHITNNSYFLCYEADVIEAMFERLRNYEGTKSYPKTCGKFHVKHVRDLTAGFDDSQKDNKPILPVSKSSQMITFTFEEGIVATLRTSGTEPKIKYYTEICGKPGKETREELEQRLNDLVTSLVEEYFQPEKNNIRPKAD
ncbi:Phosphoglucomutase-2 [Hypsibius exemplaris]|uniref:Phosphoglucomutase-2 n=1 Tax=Hypsibius exemplaris TaxID=2072580 RepID=A0A1W0WP91_HYPEX|nr:Phosphoglucomutase-2 [Hypsibius exemplaris]